MAKTSLYPPNLHQAPRSPSTSHSQSVSQSQTMSISSKTHDISHSQSQSGSNSRLPPNQSSDSTEDEQRKQQPRLRKIGRWYIGETLGKGGYSWVKKGRDEKNGKYVALKFVDRKKSNGKWSTKRAEQIKTEITVLKEMKHPNIVRLFAYNMKAKYPERDGSERDVMLLVLEYMPGGELFDILYYTNALSEILARTYCQQLMSGVEALHNACINHRDLKPQNLLLDKRFNLKITDFGLSKIIESDEDAIMTTYKVGTRGYQAPEILLKKPYTNGCDIFACGVILFLLLTGYPPFQTASQEDKWYGNIARGKIKKFWKQHRGCGLGPYAIDLITKMLAFDPNQRITLPLIKKHPWYKGETVDTKDLRRILQLRHSQMEVKRSNDPIKQNILVASEKFRALGHDDEKEDHQLQAPTISDEDDVGIYDVFTTHAPMEVLNYLKNFSRSHFGIEPAIDKENLRTVIQTAFQSETISAEMSKCEALVCVYYYPEYKCNLVKFIRMEGDYLLWKKTYEQLLLWLRPVLDGVPESVEKDKLVLSADDQALIDSLFRSPAEDKKLKKQNSKQLLSSPSSQTNVGITLSDLSDNDAQSPVSPMTSMASMASIQNSQGDQNKVVNDAVVVVNQ